VVEAGFQQDARTVSLAIQAGADANLDCPRRDQKGYDMGYGNALRAEVHNDGTTPLIGIFDMYSASLAAEHYGGMFVSGFGLRRPGSGLPCGGAFGTPRRLGCDSGRPAATAPLRAYDIRRKSW
jgi:hypothetical protein